MEREAVASRPPLDRPAIVAAGIALADESGVGALTMRKLADSLGFKVMALYNHVASKEELLGLMVDAVAAEIADPPEGAEPFEAVRHMAMSTREVFVAHPWAPQLWLSHVPGPARVRHMENLLRVLDRSGLSAEIAHHGFHAVDNHVLGYTLQEQAMATGMADTDPDTLAREFLSGLPSSEFPYTIEHIRQHLDGETSSSFELVLDLILEGLVRLDGSR